MLAIWRVELLQILRRRFPSRIHRDTVHRTPREHNNTLRRFMRHSGRQVSITLPNHMNFHLTVKIGRSLS